MTDDKKIQIQIQINELERQGHRPIRNILLALNDGKSANPDDLKKLKLIDEEITKLRILVS